MTETHNLLQELLGQERLNKVTNLEANIGGGDDSNHLTNALEIHCECKTIILKPNQARLIVPSKSMLEMEKDLICLQRSDKFFKDLVHGCYWSVDDMYKFEQIGYTKEINAENLAKLTAAHSEVSGQASNKTFQESSPETLTKPSPSAPNGLRYLLCAECNLCPLGWFNPETKESYLYVW